MGRGDARLQSAHDTERCLQRGEELYPQRSVIVFHDSLKAERNMREAMPRAIEWLQEQGYEFKVF